MKRLNALSKKIRLIICLVLLIVLILPLLAGAHDLDTPVKNILVIFSYSPTYPSSQILLNGLNDALEDSAVALQVEYMDSKLVNTPENRALFYDMLKMKMGHINQIDLIITFDDNALIFIDEYYNDLFGHREDKIPVIFDGCNDFENARRIYEKWDNFTGRFEGTSRIETIEMAVTLNPYFESINVIVDNSTTAQAYVHQVTAINNGKYPIRFINTTEYSFDELNDYLHALTENDILVFVAGYTDKNDTYLTYQQASEFVTSHVSTPVYCNDAYNIDTLFAGGYVPNKAMDGEITGQTAYAILYEGKSPADFGLEDDPNRTMSYMYNSRILKKYGMNINLLPSSAVLVGDGNRTFLNNPNYIAIFITVCAGLGVIITLLLTYAIKKHRSAKENEHVAHTDHLTSAGSRMAFYIKIKRTIDECISLGNKATLIFFDVDHFKEINDKYGHTIGDIVLQATIKRIQNSIKNYGDIYRYGGDEFIILLYLGGRNAMPYIKKIIKSFDHPIRAEGQIIPVSLSLGAVEIPTHGTKINDLIVKADAAMYKAKAYEFSRAVFHIDESS